MGMRGERNTWLSCTVLLPVPNVMPLERHTRGRRAQKGSEQCACCGLECDREPARQRRQRQGKFEKEVNSVHIDLKVTEQARETRQPEPRTKGGGGTNSSA